MPTVWSVSAEHRSNSCARAGRSLACRLCAVEGGIGKIRFFWRQPAGLRRAPPLHPRRDDRTRLDREAAGPLYIGEAYGRPEARLPWRGKLLQRGALTANGEKFNPNELTAAHPSLPFGTKLRVTNTSNGQSVTVRVNDRGPFVQGRVVDVSYSAARALGMVGAGTAKVKLDVVQ
jgi:Lytic transglycolase